MRLYRTKSGVYAENNGQWYQLKQHWQELITNDDLANSLPDLCKSASQIGAPDPSSFLAPLERGEVWAAGVTYFRSRTARMEESRDAGGGSIYDRVYEAERPELFFKSTPHRTVGHGAAVHIRSDAHWNVPEPELALVIAPSGRRIGYTVGNDMSSRDIEGENPLYLPQAKVYDRSCALGPCVLVTTEPLGHETTIDLRVERSGKPAFEGRTLLAEMKRSEEDLIHYLLKDNSFPDGCILLTGTGVIPQDEFSLRAGDRIHITIPPVGTLSNTVD